ncbi:MAG: hypothetical protein IT361_06880 [Gemmatimonadaceae bacterium]|nr:hypothetical protein [Gemmatimonadaceae bacterium]
MSTTRLFILAALLLSPVALVEAQGAIGPARQPVSIGARVRVLAPSLRRDRFVGRIDSLDTGEMVLDTAGVRRRLGFEMGPVLVESFRRVRIRTGAIDAIEVSGGRTTRSATIKGILIGGVIGAALIGFGQAPEVNPTFKDFLKSAPVGLAIGAVVGGGVGYALGGEKWLPADVPK